MSKKTVIYYSDPKGQSLVWDYIRSLPSDEQKKCFKYISYLEQIGEEIRRPFGDYLGQKLYELRPKQTRIIYFFFFKNYAILLHAFRKKTNAIPERDIQLAWQRMNDFIVRHKKGEIQL